MNWQKNDRFLKHTNCPQCGSKDNLGVWEDGHSFCFGCGYTDRSVNSNRIDRYKPNPVATPSRQVVLPEDVDTYIPAHCRSWIAQSDLTEHEILENKLLYSEKWNRLIFPYFDQYGNLVAWQGRGFSPKDRKWFSQGDLKKLYHILPHKRSYDDITLTEDICSAIKVSRHTPAMPIFGCVIGLERLMRLSKLTPAITIWLDPDKRSEALKWSFKASLFGLSSRVIFSDKDPKEHTNAEIVQYLEYKPNTPQISPD